MNENKFNYIVGVLLIVLLVVVVYVGGKVNMLEDDLLSLSDRVDAIEAVTLGYDYDADEELGYYGDEDYTASVYDSVGDEYYDYAAE
ncbi:MAG: hypothetical protein AAB847_00535 [Patescibacteria group bacterium]